MNSENFKTILKSHTGTFKIYQVIEYTETYSSVPCVT